MIGSLRGTLLDRSLTGEVLIEVSGVGYRVQAGPATSARLGDLGGDVFAWIHHHVREDAETLYGFATKGERDAFEALLGAHGVGPALALAILSVHPPANLARVLADDDVAALCLVPFGDEMPAGLNAGDGPGPSPSARADVRDALAGLGYGPEEIAEATRELPDADAGTLLKTALQRLASAR